MYSINYSERELNSLESVAMHAAEEVAPILKENFGKTAHANKTGARDWVTQWDTWAEEQITDKLQKFDADIGILGEEHGSMGDTSVYWTIDAIDGTGGFVRGIDTCTTMLALVDHGRPVVSVIHDFVRGDQYTAVAGGGAYVNGVKSLRVSSRPMQEAYVETYIPLDQPVGERASSMIREAGAFILQTASAGHMFAQVARGATEGFIGLENPYATVWDYAPGALLVHEAGGMVRNIGSEAGYTVDRFDMIASNQSVYSSLADIALQSKQSPGES